MKSTLRFIVILISTVCLYSCIEKEQQIPDISTIPSESTGQNTAPLEFNDPSNVEESIPECDSDHTEENSFAGTENSRLLWHFKTSG